MEEPFRLLGWQGKPQDANKLALAPGPELTNVAQQAGTWVQPMANSMIILHPKSSLALNIPPAPTQGCR